MPAVQSKYYVFTLNNYTAEDETRLRGVTQCVGGPNYILWGREVGESGTPHLQGYVEFPKKKALGGVKKALGSKTIHLEIRRGTQEEACLYCKKGEDWEEFGTRSVSAQGARTDLEAVRNRLIEGESLESVALDNVELYCKYRNGLRDIAAWSAKKSAYNPPRVEIVWGPPGTGKSAYAHSLAEDDDDIWVYPGSMWFDGYTGQSVALFDDFADDLLPKAQRRIDYHFWLRIVDRYKIDVPVKGSTVAWRPKVIIITTNRDPASIYSMMPDYNKDAFMRRVHEIKHFTKDFPWVGLNNLVNQ